jgi:hypothetical protein
MDEKQSATDEKQSAMEEKQFGNEKYILQVNYVKRSSFKFLT